jgi:ribonuclease Z
MGTPQDPAQDADEARGTCVGGGGMSRRAFVRGSSVLAAAAAAGAFGAGGILGAAPAKASPGTTGLPPFVPGTPLEPDQMRISFMGTSFLPRIAQQCNSVYVELGNGDSFVFDFGSGVSSKYVAMGVPYSRMTRVFLTHLHGDHMSDLITLYCFGPATDRKTPLHIYGPSGDHADEGTDAFCKHLYSLTKWHRESFSFLSTGLKGQGDGYDIVPHELSYMRTGIAYEGHGVVITHFPAIHDRDGSISYKLEWNGLSMVFSGDTKPNDYMLRHGKGVDVLVHEMVVPASVWATKNSGLNPGDDGYAGALKVAKMVQRSSHTPELALGYILEKTQPRLGIATHFQANDDTILPATKSVREWYAGPFAIAVDGFVVTVSKDSMSSAWADLDQYAWYPKPTLHDPSLLKDPKYSGPLAQLNRRLLKHVIPPTDFNRPPSAA